MRSPGPRFWICLFCGVLLSVGTCFGQAPHLPFRRIGYEQGLSNSTIECIYQDSRGFIWLGTRDGLNRYDGNEMTVYRNQPADSLSISDNYIRCILEDADHILWIGTSDGLNRFDRVTRTFTHYLNHSGQPGSLGAGAINTLYLDRQKRLWVGTDGDGLNFLDKDAQGRIKGFVRVGGRQDNKVGAGDANGAPDAGNGSLGDRVNAIYQSPGGDFWIGTEKGLSHLDPNLKDCARVTDVEGKIAIPTILLIKADPSGDLWLGTAADGVLVFHGMGGGGAPAGASGSPAGAVVSGRFTPYRHQDRDPGSLAGNMIKSMLVDQAGNIWVGCINGGLNLFNASKGTFYHYQNAPLDPSSVSQRTASAIFEDNQGNLWVGTHRGGLNLYMAGAVKFNRYPGNEGAPMGGLTNADVRAFYEDDKGQVWIGTDGGGLNVWDPKTNHWKAYRYDPYRTNTLGSDAVLDIRKDSRGAWWIATWEGGLNLFNPQTGNCKRFLHDPANPASISSSYVQKTFEDKQGRIWVATYFGGLDLLDPATGTFRRITSDPSGETQVSGNNMVSIDEDHNGNIWIGTDDGGLNRCDIRTGRFSHYFTHDGKSPDIRVIFTDHRGRLWIGQSGLYLYDPVKDTFNLYTDKAGLSHAFIKGITEDGQGNFWISTAGGLTCFNPDTYDVSSYNIGDGLQGLEFEAGAYLETRSGEMFFGGTSGFNTFYPRDIHRNPYIPPVYITGLQVFGQTMDIRDTLRLGFRQSTFAFTFTALNYVVPENNQYAYMLEGFDKDWHYVGNEHKAGYTNLDPGTYVFRVKASNNDGLWNDQGASVTIVIAPPFWKTGWFWALVTILAVGSAAGFYRVKRNLELARLEEKKREEIREVQLQFFTNISHELRTPLTLILGQAEKLFKADASASLRHYYASIHRNAGRLMSLINELMDFRKLETGALPLHVMAGNLPLFLEEISEEFADWAEEKNIRFTVKARVDSPMPAVWFDRQILEKIVLNLLHNAFKYTDKGGTITLEALSSLDGFAPTFANELVLRHDFRAARYVYVRVADSGIGISKESIAHLFERYYRISESHLGSGVGLAFVRSLTQLHKGDILVYSERNKGTEIIVGIPAGEESYTATEKWVSGKAAGQVQLESIRASEAVDATGGNGAEQQEIDPSVPLLLIVEDNEDLRDFLADSFRPYYRIAQASDGQSGWDAVRESFPDLIISDVMMPGLSGIDLCRLVKQDAASSHIPFIMLTAKDTAPAKMEGVESGADYYFTKPVSMDLLLATIKNIFGRQQRVKERYAKDYQTQALELVHSKKDKDFMEGLLDVIESQLINPDLDVDYLCGQMGMSRTKLYQKIKQVSGQSIGEFVRSIRLRKAVYIMLHEDVPFTDIMYRIGIQSQSYFTKAFKKEFGKTPTQFMQDAKR